MSVELFLPCAKNNCVCKIIWFIKHVPISVLHMFLNHNYSEPVGVRNLHAICEKVWLKKPKQFCRKTKSESSRFPKYLYRTDDIRAKAWLTCPVLIECLSNLCTNLCINIHTQITLKSQSSYLNLFILEQMKLWNYETLAMCVYKWLSMEVCTSL